MLRPGVHPHQLETCPRLAMLLQQPVVGLVVGAVVYDDDLEVRIRLLAQGRQQLLQAGQVVVAADDERYAWCSIRRYRFPVRPVACHPGQPRYPEIQLYHPANPKNAKQHPTSRAGALRQGQGKGLRQGAWDVAKMRVGCWSAAFFRPCLERRQNAGFAFCYRGTGSRQNAGTRFKDVLNLR